MPDANPRLRDLIGWSVAGALAGVVLCGFLVMFGVMPG